MVASVLLGMQGGRPAQAASPASGAVRALHVSRPPQENTGGQKGCFAGSSPGESLNLFWLFQALGSASLQLHAATRPLEKEAARALTTQERAWLPRCRPHPPSQGKQPKGGLLVIWELGCEGTGGRRRGQLGLPIGRALVCPL